VMMLTLSPAFGRTALCAYHRHSRCCGSTSSPHSCVSRARSGLVENFAHTSEVFGSSTQGWVYPCRHWDQRASTLVNLQRTKGVVDRVTVPGSRGITEVTTNAWPSPPSRSGFKEVFHALIVTIRSLPRKGGGFISAGDMSPKQLSLPSTWRQRSRLDVKHVDVTPVARKPHRWWI
jgi:hypothetical protein